MFRVDSMAQSGSRLRIGRRSQMLQRRSAMRRRLTLSVLLALPLLCPVPCRSQARPPSTGSTARTFSLSGSIRNSDDGRPYEMVKVDLKRVTGEVLGTTFTRSNGEFEFYGLPNGLYLIVVEEKGFEPIRENVEIFNSARAGVYIFLMLLNDSAAT